MKKRRKAKTAAPTRAFHYSERPLRSTLVLAPGAIEGRAAALYDAPDRSPACAGLSLAVVHCEALREITELAVGAGEILQARATGLDRFAKHVLDGADEALQTVQRDRTAGAFRMDAGAVKRFAHVDIAEPRDDPLVAKQQLDRRAPSAQALVDVTKVEAERFRPERLERRPLVERIRRDEIDRTEPPRIVEREPLSFIGLEQKVIVLPERRMVD